MTKPGIISEKRNTVRSKFLLFLGAVVLLLAASDCKKGYIYLGDCYSDQPDEASITIKLTLNDENYKIPLTIYQGTIDSGIIISRDTVSVESYTLTEPVNRYYSAVAEYKSGKRIIKVVDGTKLDVSTSTQEDGSTCYQVTGDKLNLKLAY